jgi:SAM-dependent methyltransferase
MQTPVLDYYSETSLSAKFYDSLTTLDPSVKGDVGFYARYCPLDGRTLELGSGSGRLSFGLAASRVNVVGVERSDVMLKTALRHLGSLPPDIADRVRFIEGDATTIRLGELFHLSIAPFYLFNHLHTTRERSALLETMAVHLATGGHAILHVLPAGRVADSNAAGPGSGMKIHFEGPNEFLEITWRKRKIERDRRRMEQLVEYRHLDGNRNMIRETLERFTMSWLPDSEIEKLAQRKGLELRKVVTSFQDAPGSERIYVFQKTQAPG